MEQFSVREFRDGIKLRYGWEIADLPAMCTCGDLFTVDHAMVCRHGGLIIQRHNEIRDLEAEMLRMVCTDVETEPVLQEITCEELNRGANKAPDARLDIHARGFWDRQQYIFSSSNKPVFELLNFILFFEMTLNFLKFRNKLEKAKCII